MGITNIKNQLTQGIDKAKEVAKKGMLTASIAAALSGALVSCDNSSKTAESSNDYIEVVETPKSWEEELATLNTQIAAEESEVKSWAKENGLSEDEQYQSFSDEYYNNKERRDFLASQIQHLAELENHMGKEIYMIRILGAPSDYTEYYVSKDSFSTAMKKYNSTNPRGAEGAGFFGASELPAQTLDNKLLIDIMQEYASNSMYGMDRNEFWTQALKKHQQ